MCLISQNEHSDFCVVHIVVIANTEGGQNYEEQTQWVHVLPTVSHRTTSCTTVHLIGELAVKPEVYLPYNILTIMTWLHPSDEVHYLKTCMPLISNVKCLWLYEDMMLGDIIISGKVILFCSSSHNLPIKWSINEPPGDCLLAGSRALRPLCVLRGK